MKIHQEDGKTFLDGSGTITFSVNGYGLHIARGTKGCDVRHFTWHTVPDTFKGKVRAVITLWRFLSKHKGA